MKKFPLHEVSERITKGYSSWILWKKKWRMYTKNEYFSMWKLKFRSIIDMQRYELKSQINNINTNLCKLWNLWESWLWRATLLRSTKNLLGTSKKNHSYANDKTQGTLTLDPSHKRENRFRFQNTHDHRIT